MLTTGKHINKGCTSNGIKRVAGMILLIFGRSVAQAISVPGGLGADSAEPAFGWWSAADGLYHALLQGIPILFASAAEPTFVEVIREHMYWFLAGGTVLIVSLSVNIYITLLNRALTAEIKERKRAEAALRDSVQRFEHIASCSSDWIWETDVAGHYTYSSPMVTQLIGYTIDEIIGRHYLEFLAAAEKERVKADGSPPLDNGRRVFRERFRVRTKDGRVVIHETTAEPVRDRKGELTGYRGVNRDITDQVRFVRLRAQP